MIILPDNHSTYVRLIKLRCKNLIKFGIWEGIDESSLSLWWKNFSTDEEIYFAASILDSLLYRSDKHVGAMIFELFSRKIPNILYRRTGTMDYGLLSKLQDQWKDPKVRITAPLFEKPAQSGHVMLRRLKRKWVKERWIINPSDIKNEIDNGISVFLIVDDFCGTGQQLKEFIDKYDLSDFINSQGINLIFVNLCSHETGRIFLETHYPNILCTSAELIKADYSCFKTLNDGLNTEQNIRNFYLELLRNKMEIKKPQADRVFGRGNFEIAYAFQDAIPNNSLNVLYHDNNWNPLMNR